MRGEKNANSMLQPALEMEVTVIQTLVFRRLESCDVLGSCVSVCVVAMVSVGTLVPAEGNYKIAKV